MSDAPLSPVSKMTVCKDEQKSDDRHVTLLHGIQHERKVNISPCIQDALFLAENNECLVYDGRNVYRFDEEWQQKEKCNLEEPLDKLLFASTCNQYVAWQHQESKLFVMNDNFQVLSQAKDAGDILFAVYSNESREVITVGQSFATCWSFRYDARYLIPRQTIQTDCGTDHIITGIALEESSSSIQRLFLALSNGVKVYNLYDGSFIESKELHVRSISAIEFHDPFKYIITGAVDGCIKVLDCDWCIKMVFVGHSNVVNCLAIFPHGALFASASLDCTIRIWSMETCDEIDKTEMAEPAKGILTTMKNEVFFTHTDKKVDIWRINHLLHIYTKIGYRVRQVKLTDHPSLPPRVICLCKDGSVRIISPPSGEVVSSFLLPTKTGILDAVHSVADDVLYVVCHNGDIIKCRTDVNPCQEITRWHCFSADEMCNYLLLYECQHDRRESNMSVCSKQCSMSDGIGPRTDVQASGSVFLLAGHNDGHICLLDQDSGHVVFKVEAHDRKGVTGMIVNYCSSQVISAGFDNIIRVWRVYPFAEEVLVALMSLFCTNTPVHMSVIKLDLCVALQNPATAAFTVVLFNLVEKDRLDHRPCDDHIDTITGLSSCPSMSLFASSSLDGTIRIWSDRNTLLWVLDLNAIPNCMSFCSPLGDIFVGIGLHLFYIPWHRYLPQAYLHKMISMKFVDPTPEKPLPFDEKYVSVMGSAEEKRLKGCYAAFRNTSAKENNVSNVDAGNTVENTIEDKAYTDLGLLEKEMCSVRDGVRTALRKNRGSSSNETDREALINYMKIFFNPQPSQVPAEDLFLWDAVKEKLQAEKEMIVSQEKFRPEVRPVCFFEDRVCTQLPEHRSPRCVASLGYLPNSVLLKRLFPTPDFPPGKIYLSQYRPPDLTEKQLSEIRSLRKAGDSDYLHQASIACSNTTQPINLSALTQETSIIKAQVGDQCGRNSAELSSGGEIDEEESPYHSRKTGSISGSATSPRPHSPHRDCQNSPDDNAGWNGEDGDIQCDRPNKYKDVMEQMPSSKSSNDLAVGEESLREEKGRSSNSSLLVVQRPVRPIRKFVSRPLSRKFSPPPSQKSLSPPPQPTALPEFISQFSGSGWFKRLFPDIRVCHENARDPWCVDRFVKFLLSVMRLASFSDKSSVVEAILGLHSHDPLSDPTCRCLHSSLMAELNRSGCAPSLDDVEQKDFILVALRALDVVGVHSKDFYVEMLAQFLDGDEDVRSFAMRVLVYGGLRDPHKRLSMELDSWDVWTFNEADRRKNLRWMCSQWLDKWMVSYKFHIKNIARGSPEANTSLGSMYRSIVLPGADRVPMTDVRSSCVDEMDPHVCLSVAHASAPYGNMDSNASSAQGAVTFELEDMSTDRHHDYLHAINFFCETMTGRELMSLRRRRRRESAVHDGTSDGQSSKNTILVLPTVEHKPVLVRLGESHTTRSRSQRDSALTVDYSRFLKLRNGRQHGVPGQTLSFLPSIKLPIACVHLNPFSSPIDSHNIDPILITLKSAQKYYMPSASVIHKSDDGGGVVSFR